MDTTQKMNRNIEDEILANIVKAAEKIDKKFFKLKNYI